MAIFTPGPLIGGISGNIGGINFANPRGSKVIRKARRPQSNKSEIQLVSQAKLAIVINLWRRKPVAEQIAWKAAAAQIPLPNRLGQQRQISGYQYFIQVNTPLELQVTADVLDVRVPLPPTAVSTQVTATITFASSIANGIEMTFADLPGGSAYSGLVYGRLLYRSTPIQFNNLWRAFGSLGLLGNGVFDMTSTWQTVYDLPVLGQFIALKFQPLQNSAPRGAITAVIIETTA